MSMKLTTRDSRDVIIVDASGKLTMGGGTGAFREMMRAVTKGGHRRILLNMGDVTHIDSFGIGELVAWHQIVTNAGGEMKLLNFARHVHDLLQLAKLHLVFETFDNELTAIASFPVETPTAP